MAGAGIMALFYLSAQAATASLWLLGQPQERECCQMKLRYFAHSMPERSIIWRLWRDSIFRKMQSRGIVSFHLTFIFKKWKEHTRKLSCDTISARTQNVCKVLKNLHLFLVSFIDKVWYWYSVFTPFLPGVKLPKCCVSVSIFRTNCLEENRSEVEGQKKWALDKSLLETSKTIFPFQLLLK